MDRRENVCQSPEYTLDMINDMYKREIARACRINEVEKIIGDDYDLDRLRELVKADRDGRCVVLPEGG